MISAMVAGRLVKPPQASGEGPFIGTVVCFDSDRRVRIVLRRTVHIEHLLGLPLGTPVTVSGQLRITPVITDKGEARVLMSMEVATVMSTPAPEGFTARQHN